jgi:hypothetical protein
MKRSPVTEDTILVSCRLTLKEQQQIRDLNKKNKSVEKDAEEKPETPAQMIRSLQGVFCKGRYRSWICSGGKKVI